VNFLITLFLISELWIVTTILLSFLWMVFKRFIWKWRNIVRRKKWR
jgi:hypothetical protein